MLFYFHLFIIFLLMFSGYLLEVFDLSFYKNYAEKSINEKGIPEYIIIAKNKTVFKIKIMFIGCVYIILFLLDNYLNTVSIALKFYEHLFFL